jgi:hypothetical protein
LRALFARLPALEFLLLPALFPLRWEPWPLPRDADTSREPAMSIPRAMTPGINQYRFM